MTTIHPTAIVDPKAQIDSSVTVGPYAVIGPNVMIGAGTQVGAHAHIDGHTTIGERNHIFQFTSLGAQPQDKKYRGEPTRLVIGNGNTIREFCTFNTGTVQDKGVTQVGDDNWIMAYVHIAHDCFVADHTVIANSVQLAGHVTIEDWVIVGGLTGIHQYVRVGCHSMIGFSSRVSQDLPPFMTAAGNPISVTGINQEGLKRRGFDARRIAAIKQMQRTLYRKGLTLEQAQIEIEQSLVQTELSDDIKSDVKTMLGFLSQAERGIVR